MTTLLFDINKLKKYKINNLLTRIGKLPKTFEKLGVICILNSSTVRELINMNNQKKKMSFINSVEFIDNIKDVYFVYYNEEKNIIEMRGYTPYLKDILHSIIMYVPRDVIIWTGIIPLKNCHLYLEEGFTSPNLTNKSPLGFNFSESGIVFYKKNTQTLYKLDFLSSKNILEYIESQKSVKKCILYAKLTPDAIFYLYRLNKPAITMKNKEIHEKELAGSLKVSKVSKIDGKIVFELSGDPTSVKPGVEEEVDAVWSRYNFHTHPKKAYVNHGVKNGWPSSQDYLGFIQLNNHTIFHTVVTLEGIYIISYSSKWDGKLKNIDHKYILNNYDVDHRRKMSYQQYVNLINNKKYKGGNPLFNVKFIPWDGNTHEIFPVFYSKTGNNCLSTDESFDYYQKFT
jgi:hypothetical protein